MVRLHRLSRAFAAGLALMSIAATVKADEYPSKIITIIVPFAAGGNADTLARMVADGLDKRLGQRVIVQNNGGAGGNIGTAMVARAKPDGYTLGWGTVATNAINKGLFKTLPFDLETAFAPVSIFATFPNLLVINPKLPVKTVDDLIAMLKKEPRKYSYSSSGVGTALHLSGEMFASRANVQINHVPYKSSSQAIMDVVAGHVDMIFDNFPTAYEQVKAGTVRPLAVTGLERHKLLPEVPTMANYLPGFDATVWQGLIAPAGTPPEIVEKLSAAVRDMAKEPTMKEKLEGMGATPVGSTPDAYAEQMAADIVKWGEIIKAANIPQQ